jgi:hypothetical protein
MDTKINIARTPYFGLGVIFTPKTKTNNGHIIVNLLIWELNLQWGKVEEL